MPRALDNIWVIPNSTSLVHRLQYKSILSKHCYGLDSFTKTTRTHVQVQNFVGNKRVGWKGDEVGFQHTRRGQGDIRPNGNIRKP